jgi:hypothetical protein
MKVNRPRLVDEKVVEKIIKAQEESKPFSNIWPLIYNFLINNIFVVSIFTFIGILLLYRYYHVQSKKKSKKESSEEETVVSTEEEISESN